MGGFDEEDEAKGDDGGIEAKRVSISMSLSNSLSLNLLNRSRHCAVSKSCVANRSSLSEKSGDG